DRPGHGTSRGTTALSAACDQRNAGTETGLSVQAERSERRAVLMVRRRSTVRFRKGAQVKAIKSNRSNKVGGRSGGQAATDSVRRLGLGAMSPAAKLLSTQPQGRMRRTSRTISAGAGACTHL